MHGHAAAATGKILVWGFHKFLENLPTLTLTCRRFLSKVIFVIKKVLVLISQRSKKLTVLEVNGKCIFQIRKKFCDKKYLNTLQFSFYNIFKWILKIKFWNLFFQKKLAFRKNPEKSHACFWKGFKILVKITLKKANTNEVKILQFYLEST